MPNAEPVRSEDADALALGWLPILPDWPARLRDAEALDDPAARWSALVTLANARMDFVRTGRLDRTLVRAFGAGAPSGLATKPVRLAVLGSSTVAQLLPSIRVAGLRRGLWIATYEAEYGQYRQELEDRGSALHAFAPDAILFALDAQHLLRGADPAADTGGAEAKLGHMLEDLRACWGHARAACRGPVIQQALLPTAPALVGNNEHRLPGAPAALAARLNAALRETADPAGIDLLALDARAAQDGLARWHDRALWHRAKQEVSPAAAPLYGEMVARLLAARQGRSAKCLVLDLDNTLWGGVIGDDGLEGIVLGQGSALGEAFIDVQRYARDQARRGIILAVVSKNDEANARTAFERHPEMLLRLSDVACFIANWDDKATNIRRVAETLNIGLDALVFVDDNPFERNLVRDVLPMVAVPEVPDDPALIPACLADAGYFEAVAITAEDRDRTRLYQENSARDAFATATTDLPGYLRGLDMRLVWRRFDVVGLGRIVQLINKTNQFNLTTRRYSEAEVRAVMEDARAFGLQLRLLDRFGDNGIIAIVIGRMRDDGDLLIDTWLMSCRVLGRQVEAATLALVAAEARRLGAARLVGDYRPTAKNGMVRDHYARLGFSAAADAAEGGSRSILALDAYAAPELFIATVAG